MRRLAITVAGILLPLMAAAGQAPIGAGIPVTSHQFSRVAGIVEVANGGLLVADARDEAFYLVDRNGAVRQVGRHGQGPGEYRSAFGLTRVRGDTILGYDARNRQFVRFSPAGVIDGTIPIPTEFLRGGIAAPGGADRAGRTYWYRPRIEPEPPLPFKRQATGLVVRWLPGSSILDTAATVQDHAPSMHQHRFHPFPERDAWVVAPDGRLVVVVAAGYRLRWIEPGGATTDGPALDAKPVPVTAADRDAFREDRARNPAGVRAVARDGATPSPGLRRQMTEAYPDAAFPPFKPPFAEDGARIAPGGDIWVTRTRTAADRVALVDLITPNGTRRGSVTLPPHSRVAALERGAIYLVSTDEDGLETIIKVPWTAALR